MKVAIIGRGFGSYAMKPAFRERGWDVTMVPSRDADAVAQACAGDFDLIAVHSPPFQHHEHVLRAIAAGKDVLCDKPFGRNAAEAREMRDAALAAGVLDFVNYEFRSQPAMVKARELIREGAIGQLRHIAITSHAAYMSGRPHGWLNDASLGGGWIGAWGSHQIDAVRWFSGGEVAECSAVTRIDVPERPGEDGSPVTGTAEDAFVASLTLQNGATALLDAAFAVPVNLPGGTHVLGSEGALEIVNNAVVTLHKAGADPQVFDEFPSPGGKVWPSIYYWIEAIEAARASRTRIAPNFDDGVAAAEVMDKLRG
jgi:predicted dehydrogenase